MVENLGVLLKGPKQVELEREEISGEVSVNELLIRARYSLISPGTELALYTGTHIRFGYKDERRWAYPLYIGYATVGQVECVGEGVTAFSPGDWVFVEARHHRYVVVDPSERMVCKLPSGMDLRAAPFAILATISNTAVQLSPPASGDTVAVLGLGLVGNLAGQLYHHAGAKVIGIDLIESRCAIARRCGFDQIINPQNLDLLSEIQGATDGKGADIVIEATGSPSAVPTALSLARRRGQVILLGSTRGVVRELDVYSLIHHAGRVVKGAHVSVFPRFETSGESYSRYVGLRQMLELIAHDELIISPLITDIVSPEDVQSAYENLLNRKESHLGVLIDWERS